MGAFFGGRDLPKGTKNWVDFLVRFWGAKTGSKNRSIFGTIFWVPFWGFQKAPKIGSKIDGFWASKKPGFWGSKNPVFGVQKPRFYGLPGGYTSFWAPQRSRPKNLPVNSAHPEPTFSRVFSLKTRKNRVFWGFTGVYPLKPPKTGFWGVLGVYPRFRGVIPQNRPKPFRT